MKRKLINYDTFTKITEGSLSAAERELVKAEDVLARALDADGLTLHCFGESDVTYETPQHTFVHATYKMDGKAIVLENIEELVIDEAGAKTKRRQALRQMIEALVGDNKAKADQAFTEYLTMPTTRQQMSEGAPEFWVEPLTKSKAGRKRGSQPPDVVAKRVRGKKLSQSLISDSEKKEAKRRRDALKKQFGGRVRVHARFKSQKAGKKMDEWSRLVENVAGYMDFQEFGHVMKDSQVRTDDNGNVTSVRIPNSVSRNEGKVLQLTYKNMLDTELKCLRTKAKVIHEDNNFCRAMQDLRKCNALSDDAKMQEVLEAVAGRWPELLYLTQQELAARIAEALEAIGESNYDDEVCEFLAEGILRTAAAAHSDKVRKVFTLAGVQAPEADKAFESFQDVTAQFYANLDETLQLEMQVFADLYGALVEVHNLAKEEGNEALRSECNTLLKNLYAVLQEGEEPTLDLAGQAAGFLAALVETNLDGSTWNVSNKTHQTEVGDHPDMAKKAAKGYTPSSDFSGNWGDPAPVSDGKSYKGNGLADEMRNKGWGNFGDGDCWPALKNPYLPRPFGEYRMKEKSAVDDGQNDHARYQDGDTWPNLQNPVMPAEKMKPGQYKMKSDNLVVDQ